MPLSQTGGQSDSQTGENQTVSPSHCLTVSLSHCLTVSLSSPPKPCGIGLVWDALAGLLAENKIHCAADAETGPEVVPFQGLLHVKEDEGHEDSQCDGFLDDFKLR